MSNSIARVSVPLGIIFCLCSQSVTARIYHIVPLDPLSGDYCIPEGINVKGEIVGDIVINNGAVTHTFVWQSGVTTDLGTLGGDAGVAWDINDLGMIVGNATDNSGKEHAFFTTTAGGLTPLDQLSYAGSINNNGDIAGTTADGLNPAILSGGNLTVVPISGGGYGINDSGWFVGQMNVALTVPPYTVGHGFLYKNGQVTDLGLLYPGNDAWARDINDSGLIVGVGKVLGYQHPCEWRDEVIKDLYQTGGVANSYCYKVNNRGDIVGGAYPTGGARYYPFYLLNGGTGTVTVKDSGWQLFEFNGINDSGQIIGGGILGGQMSGILLDPVKIRLKLVDVRNMPVALDTVKVYKLEKNPPIYPSTPMGTFVSDDKGIITLPEDSIDIGTMFKVELMLAKTDYNKHVAVLQTMDRHFLDNAQFDSLGYMTWDTISGDTIQPVKLGHSTMAYNLVVSIQWDADPGYVSATETGFRKFSNYLYDVSDGQIRLDTVDIFTNAGLWSEADMRICASNMVWPNAKVFGINQPGGYLSLPPRWFGSDDLTRNGTYSEYPLNLAAPSDYRTRCHEFGHYALGFYDEYRFVDSAGVERTDTGRCVDPAAANYGYMDYAYDNAGWPYNSEMSSAARYTDVSCRNSAQYKYRNMSCWDFLKSWAEYYDTDRGVQVPILRPSDRTLATGLDYIPGPNDDPETPFALDYNVGLLVQFPIPHTTSGASTVPITISDKTTGVGLKKSGVMIRRNARKTFIDEGQTDDFGRVRLLGYLPTDTVMCSGRISVIPGAALAASNSDTWFSGIIAPGNVSSYALDVSPLAGYYPLVCSVQLDSLHVTYAVSATRTFGTPPSFELSSSSGSTQISSLGLTAGGYSATLPDSLGVDGIFTVNATDDSAHSFFFLNPYITSTVDSTAPAARISGPNGSSELRIAGPGGSIKRFMLMSSAYPVIRTGLDAGAMQGGDAISLAVDPALPLSGGNHLIIRYSDQDLYSSTGDPLENYLRIYRWDDGFADWALVGGAVDSSRNEVSTEISAAGVYAAFTTNAPTGIDDHGSGSLLPEQFELGQNYPNPFNPSTTISFALPERAHIKLAIYNILGEQVRVLVDETRPAGRYEAVWDGRNSMGVSVASGVYLYTITTERFSDSKKMLLLK